jgi:hypothetical protein
LTSAQKVRAPGIGGGGGGTSSSSPEGATVRIFGGKPGKAEMLCGYR